MTSGQFRDRLWARAAKADASIPEEACRQLEAYFRVLAQWNAKINLTALPLQRPSDETFDRLLIEPFAAARYIPDSAIVWFDIGSGGGSPAIPLKIARPGVKLTMIESKARKAAFLREVVRTLELRDVVIENDRFENVASAVARGSVDLATVRGVRCDAALFSTLHRVLSPGGRAFFFGSTTSKPQIPADFGTVEVVQLRTGHSRVTILKPMFHVKQSG